MLIGAGRATAGAVLGEDKFQGAGGQCGNSEEYAHITSES